MNELQSLSEIFQNKLFRIPDYQRGYAWQDNQLRDFWEDLLNLQADKYHYVGMLSIKLIGKDECSKMKNDQWLLQNGYKAYHIVDGQQRLTTFIIMLNEIINLVVGLPENKGKTLDEIYFNGVTLSTIKSKYICQVKLPEGIVETYLFGYESDNPSSEYLIYKVLGKQYSGSVEESYYTKNLQYAKDFFSKELEHYYSDFGYSGIEYLYRKLTLQLMFNIHMIEDDYDVFVAFETMNNRGKKLSNLELLKNRLIYLTTLYDKSVLDDDEAEALRELVNSTWREIYRQLGRNKNELLSDDEFLRAHWIIYFKYTRKRGDDYFKFLLKKFSQKNIYSYSYLALPDEESVTGSIEAGDVDEDVIVGTEPYGETQESSGLIPTDIKEYVNSLKETAEYWYYTYYPDECASLSEDELVWIEKLNRIGISYFRPLVAVSLVSRLGFSSEERIALYKAIERFIFIDFRMAMYQSSYKSSDINRKIRELYSGDILISDVTDELNSTVNSDAKEAVNVFVSKMVKRFETADGFYSWYALKYFLYEYDYSLVAKHKIEKLQWAVLSKVVKDKITVEHILPQTPTKLYWRNNFRQFKPEEIRTLSASLGNLLPLAQSINSSLQNDDFNEKKRRGYLDGCHSEVEVAKKEKWTAEEIYDRGMKLLHFMEKRWGFQFESKKQMEDLLQLTFVHDGREIPPVIDGFDAALYALVGNKETEDRYLHIVGLVLRWLKTKEDAGEIQVDWLNCEKQYCRFSTNTMTAIMPNGLEPNSGWHTNHYYYYEVVNEPGEKVHMQLSICTENIPDDLLAACERIEKHFEVKNVGTYWKLPFVTESVEIQKGIWDSTIIGYLENQYGELQAFEKELAEVFGE